VRRLLRLVLVAALAVWAWRSLLAGREPQERASVAYADGSSLVLEPGTAAFERLAAHARRVLAP
jgi:ferric-dicitrate binding protein FerR (iron transport regulator)